MVVITNMGTAPATRSCYNSKEIKSVWLLNTKILCQKGVVVPYFLWLFLLFGYYPVR